MRTERRGIDGRGGGHVVVHLEVEEGADGVGVDDEGALGEAWGCCGVKTRIGFSNEFF